MRTKGKPPYENYWVYSPVMSKTEGRRVVVLRHRRTKRMTSMSLARYMLSTHLGRRLARAEHVDHVDGDKSNDVLENLQVLTPEENNRKHRLQQQTTKHMLKLRCPACRKVFTREFRQTHRAKHGKFTACSRGCAGTLRQRLQSGVLVDLTDNVIEDFRASSSTG